MITFPRPEKLERKVRELEKKGMTKSASLDVDPARLKEKARRIYDGAHEQFTGKEKRNLPFLLEPGADEKFCKFLLKETPGTRVVVFRRIFQKYMVHYVPHSRFTDLLEKELREDLRQNGRLGMSMACLRNVPDLLEKGPNALRPLLENGFRAGINAAAFPNNLKQSRFVYCGIYEAFRKNTWPLQTYLARLEEIASAYAQDSVQVDVSKPSYKLMPLLADGAIRRVDKDGSQEDRERLTRLLTKRNMLGTPRFSVSPDGRLDCGSLEWSLVSQEARRIFKNWWNQSNLDLFFEIIARSVQSNPNADRMWRYRKAFWNAYIPDMVNTSVVLGKEALAILRQLPQKYQEQATGYARLQGGQGQSLLLFTIGGYTFIEVSHNGKLRVYKDGGAPISVSQAFARTYGYTAVQYSHPDNEFRHSSPKTYSWQKNVAGWLERNCGVWRGSNQWSL